MDSFISWSSGSCSSWSHSIGPVINRMGTVFSTGGSLIGGCILICNPRQKSIMRSSWWTGGTMISSMVSIRMSLSTMKGSPVARVARGYVSPSWSPRCRSVSRRYSCRSWWPCLLFRSSRRFGFASRHGGSIRGRSIERHWSRQRSSSTIQGTRNRRFRFRGNHWARCLGWSVGCQCRSILQTRRHRGF